jgi:hypothetical protein
MFTVTTPLYVYSIRGADSTQEEEEHLTNEPNFSVVSLAQ